MSKGSDRRPRRVSDDAFEEAWYRVFGSEVSGDAEESEQGRSDAGGGAGEGEGEPEA